jgi:hypothetical protein
MNNFEEFDWKKYIDYYDDLRNILKTKENAINHWLSIGCIQNRYFFTLENSNSNKVINEIINNNEDIDNNNQNFTINMFDWEKYLDLNIDLQDIILTKEQAYHHWKECGKKEGREFCSIEKPNDFNWLVYISLNNDLKDIIITEEEAILHWNNYGKNENRLYKVKEKEIDESFDNFDWEAYIEFNKDLRNIIRNKDQAYHHWKECGKKEGRAFFEIEKPKDFDWLVYVYLNNDLKQEINTEEKAIYHWNNFGKKEERKYCFGEEDFKKMEKFFDWEVYTTFYEDLNVLTNKEIAYNHYITLGYKEGRKFFFKQNDIYENIKYEFDWKKYVQFYDDLQIDNKKDAIDHFLKLGSNENRTYFLYETQDINNFDWEKYLYHYEDLKHIDVNEDNAVSHWLNYGKKEGRIFFRLDDIDDEQDDDINIFKYYKKEDDDDDKEINKDLEEGVSVIKKTRSNSSDKYFDFNWKKYLSFYNDISNSDNKTKEDAVKHWETIGSKDGRVYFKILNDLSNEISNIDYVFNKIHVFAIDDLIDKSYSKIDYFKTKFYNDDEDKIINNIELLKKINLSNTDNILIINNKNISFDYLKYFKISLKKLFESNDQGYDLVQLCLINHKNDFYKNLDKDIDISEYAKNNFDCFYITSSGINKLLNKNFEILEDWNIGYYSRPLFGYINKNYKELNNLWSSYYYVVNYWDKIYCTNIGYDTNKYKDMNKYFNLLNSSTDIIYNQLSDIIIPSIDELIDLNIFDETFKNRVIKEDEICTSLTHCNIFRESFKNNYNNILIINDNIDFKNDYFNILYKIFNKYSDIDILYIGVNKNEDYNEKNIFNCLDTINIDNDSYDIYRPSNNNAKLYNFIGVSLSSKALRILNEKSYRLRMNSYELINNLAFNEHSNYNLNCLYVEKNIFSCGNRVNNDITNIKKNKNINYLTKLKKINYKLNQNYKFKISIMNNVQTNYIDILKFILKKFKNYTIVKDNSYDIIVYTPKDSVELKDTSLNICINYNNDLSKDQIDEIKLEKADIHITGSQIAFDNFNIYYPYMFLNLFNRMNNGKNYVFNKKIVDNNVFYNKTNFCAYLENTDFVSVLNTYKTSDLLDDMFNNEKYGDLLIEKYREYKFVICNDDDDNISEKIINAIIANCIPIYFGSSDIFNYINKKRFIYSRDFTNYNDLLNYIIKLDNDMNLYSSVLEESVFIGNIRYDNLEEYLEDKIDKSFGLKSKNILLNNNYVNNKQSEFVDFKIKQLKLDCGVDNDKLIKRYLNNFIREDDMIL